MLLKKLYSISYGYKKFEIFPSFCWNNKFKIFTFLDDGYNNLICLISFHMNIVFFYFVFRPGKVFHYIYFIFFPFQSKNTI